MVNGMESTTLIMIRLSEMMHPKIKVNLQDLISIQESGNPRLPCDHYTDCRDLWELSTGQKTLPQDKTQRLYILGVREARITGRIRMVVLVPTQSMLADALTKPMLSPGLLHTLTTGVFDVFGMPEQPVLARVLPSLNEYDEQTLLEGDDKVLEVAKENHYNIKVTHSTILYGMVAVTTSSTMRTAMMIGMATLASAHEEMQPQPIPSYFPIYVMIFMTVIVAVIFERIISKMFENGIIATLRYYITKLRYGILPDKVKVEISDDDAMEVDQDNTQIHDLQAEITDLREFSQKLEENRDEYKERMETILEKLRDTQLEHDGLQRDLEREKREHETTKSNYRLTQNRLTAATEKVKEKDSRIEDLKEQLRQANSKIPSGSSSSDASKQPELLNLHHIDMRALKDELEKKTLELEINERKMLQHDREIETYKTTVRQQREKIERMTTTYHELRAELQSAYFPEQIKVTPNGAKYHVDNCRHLYSGKEPRNFSILTKCRDCCNKA